MWRPDTPPHLTRHRNAQCSMWQATNQMWLGARSVLLRFIAASCGLPFGGWSAAVKCVVGKGHQAAFICAAAVSCLIDPEGSALARTTGRPIVEV